MSLKAELEAWAAALHSYDEDDLEGALEQFEVSQLSHITSVGGEAKSMFTGHSYDLQDFCQYRSYPRHIRRARNRSGEIQRSD